MLGSEHLRLPITNFVKRSLLFIINQFFLVLQPTQAVNYLGAFYLTHLLLQKLQKTSSSRILNLTSLVEPTGSVTWDDLG